MTGAGDKLAIQLAILTTQAKGLRIELEAWRTHSGSQGHFLQMAIEDLEKAVKELRSCVLADAMMPDG